ncbi:VIT domain-containing protein [Nannocystis bainbridge]|uniref:VIT domain-containing protein n=1 Tax=Nannocystis bainbridge TaxID=2995303 RepID=A0ABT5DZL3_9BACT|nr:VIT domain-containing protein [Nannocystis bainbridge]MDC0719066.1 VIT domain-containing protein [Nannocystis bainbridge]
MIPTALTIDPTLTQPLDEPAFGRLETSQGRLPLAALSVNARISGLQVATEIQQTFVNNTGAAIEATYIFPLPDRAAVYAFRMQVQGRIVDGVIDERGRAREVYEQAIAAGQRAAIAEEDRPGVFTLRVGNLVPGDHAVITLRTVGPLPIEDGEVTWAFPLVVAPRYIPGAPLGGEQAGTGLAADTDRVPDASRISPPVLLPGFASPVRLALAVTVDGAGLPVSNLRASLHEVFAAPEAGGWRLELRPGERLDRDFILRWTLGDAALHSAAVWAPDADGEGATAVLTIVPPVGAAAQGRPRDVVLVLDRSGSMGGWKMVAARRAAARIIDTLGARDRFAVLAFDNTVESPPSLGAQLATASDRNRFRAVEYLAGLQERGGTDLTRPLALATRMLAGDDDRDRVLVLVTDGQVGNEDEILRDHGPRLGDIRVFTLGIDKAVNAGFLRRLAALGGGACELVESEERLDEVMAKIHRRIATPVLVEVSVAGDGLDLATQAPHRLPAVFAGAPLVVHARWHGQPRPGATLELRGRLPAGTEYHQRVRLDPAPPAAALAQSWARAHIRDLEDQYAARTADPSRLEQAIVAVSRRHQVLSRFTAFVAVDREVVNPGGNPRTVTQPVERPAGWSQPRFDAMPMEHARRGEPKLVGAISMSSKRSAAPPRSATLSAPPPPGARAPAPASPPRSPSPPPPRQESPEGATVSAIPYLARLGAIVRDLERAVDTAAAQLPIARLIELLEDLRTVGLDALATALAPLVDRLRGSLGADDLLALLKEAVAALRKLVEDKRSPPPPPGKRKDFWR